jgi:hypothetical protein
MGVLLLDKTRMIKNINDLEQRATRLAISADWNESKAHLDDKITISGSPRIYKIPIRNRAKVPWDHQQWPSK